MTITGIIFLLLAGFAGETQHQTSLKIRPEPQTDYVLGPGDQITIKAANLEEIGDKPMVIDTGGNIRLPLAGRIHVAGLTTAQVETEITQRIKTYVLRPDVSVAVTEFHSQPVSVLGSVKTPGVQQVQGRKTLVEMLSMAGGLDPMAGTTLKITRQQEEWGKIPLSNAKDDPTGKYSVAEVSLKSIMEARNPQENILVKPNDVISIPRAETIYVIGQVQKSGGFVLNDRESMTVLQALSMAGGIGSTARARESRILRKPAEGSTRKEIPIDLKKILDGKSPDIPMEADDILFVPASVPQKAALRALEAAVQMGTGIVIWRR